MQISNEEEFTAIMAFMLIVVALTIDGAYALVVASHLASP